MKALYLIIDPSENIAFANVDYGACGEYILNKNIELAKNYLAQKYALSDPDSSELDRAFDELAADNSLYYIDYIFLPIDTSDPDREIVTNGDELHFKISEILSAEGYTDIDSFSEN